MRRISGSARVVLAVLLGLAAAGLCLAHGGHGGIAPTVRELQVAGRSWRLGVGIIPSEPVSGEDVRIEVNLAEVTSPDSPAERSASLKLAVRVDQVPVELRETQTAGVFSGTYRADSAGVHDVAVYVGNDSAPPSINLPLRVGEGPEERVRPWIVAFLILAAAIVAAFIWSRRTTTPVRARPRLWALATVTVALAIVLLGNSVLPPLIARRLLPDRSSLVIDWVPAEGAMPGVSGSAQPGVRNTVTVVGYVRPVPKMVAQVIAPMWGRVEFADKPLAVGQTVRKGQPLIRLVLELSATERYLQETRTVELKSAVAIAGTRKQRREVEYRQTIALLKSEPGSKIRQQQLVAAERLLQAATEENALYVRQARAYEAVVKGRDPRRTLVEAPMSGVLTEFNVAVGQVNPTGAFVKIGTIVDISRVWIEADVFEGNIASVLDDRTSALFKLSEGDQPQSLGPPIAVLPWVDAASRTIKVIFEVPNPHLRLKLGMAAYVTFETAPLQPGGATTAQTRLGQRDTGLKTE